MSPPLFASVSSLGGVQPDLSPARNLLIDGGLRLPNGTPPSDALIFGCSGGIGFLYGAFSYSEFLTLTIVARNQSMPDPTVERLFDNLGVSVTKVNTGSAAVASKALRAACDTGSSTLFTVGAGLLDYLGLEPELASMAPRVVRLVGYEQDVVWIDDLAGHPQLCSLAAFESARGAIKKARHQSIQLLEPLGPLDWPHTVLDAIVSGARDYDSPPVPQFASNVGTAGLIKWSRLLTDHRNPKGWPRMFRCTSAAATALSRLTECLDIHYTSPGASRPLFAEFLGEASQLTGVDFSAPQALIEQSAQHWSAIVSRAREAHPNIERFAELSATRKTLMRSGATPESGRLISAEQANCVCDCDILEEAAIETFRLIASEVSAIVECEREAISMLSVGGGHAHS